MYLAAAVLIGVGLSTVIVITAGSSANPPAAAAAAAPQTTAQPNPLPSVSSVSPIRSVAKTKVRLPKPLNTDNTDQKHESIKVVMQIENGRVLNASVANHKPGMDNYEAMALRIARQRRYATTVTGGQTVTISVNPQE